MKRILGSENMNDSFMESSSRLMENQVRVEGKEDIGSRLKFPTVMNGKIRMGQNIPNDEAQESFIKRQTSEGKITDH